MIGRIDSLQDAFRRKLKYVHDYRQTEQRPTSQEVNENSRQLYANGFKRGETQITKTHFVSFLHPIGSENGESLHDQF